MKKILFTITAIILSISISAQVDNTAELLDFSEEESREDTTINKNLFTANLGLYGLGANFAYDNCLKKVGVGSFTLGVQLGYDAFYAWDEYYFDVYDTYIKTWKHRINLSLRTNYRMSFGNWDIYPGIYAGAALIFEPTVYDGMALRVAPAVGVMCGLGYSINEQLSVNAEVYGGVGASIINVGITKRFGGKKKARVNTVATTEIATPIVNEQEEPIENNNQQETVQEEEAQTTKEEEPVTVNEESNVKNSTIESSENVVTRSVGATVAIDPDFELSEEEIGEELSVLTTEDSINVEQIINNLIAEIDTNVIFAKMDSVMAIKVKKKKAKGFTLSKCYTYQYKHMSKVDTAVFDTLTSFEDKMNYLVKWREKCKGFTMAFKVGANLYGLSSNSTTLKEMPYNMGVQLGYRGHRLRYEVELNYGQRYYGEDTYYIDENNNKHNFTEYTNYYYGAALASLYLDINKHVINPIKPYLGIHLGCLFTSNTDITGNNFFSDPTFIAGASAGIALRIFKGFYLMVEYRFDYSNPTLNKMKRQNLNNGVNAGLKFNF